MKVPGIAGNIRGVSLVELMVAMLIFSMVAMYGMRFLVLQHSWFVLQEDTAEAQQQVRVAIDLLGRELGLLGFGVPQGEESLLEATEREIQFLANLDSAIAYLGQDASAEQTSLDVGYVNNRGKFDENRRVSICSPERCEWHFLANDGGVNSLELQEGLSEAFPRGSVIHIVRRIRYTLRMVEPSRFNLNRAVDQGSPKPVAEGLASMQLDYLDREDRKAASLSDIHRVKIALAARLPRHPEKVRSLMAEVFLRNR